MINQQQLTRLVTEFQRAGNLTMSAMKAGMDPKTARKYVRSEVVVLAARGPRTWRTRTDPLGAAWARAEGYLRAAPELEARALFEHLLTTMAGIYAATMKSAEADHWGYRKFLQHLCESEAEERRQRRVARLLKQSGLPDGKSLGNLDESLLSAKVRRQLPTLLDGGFVERGENLLTFGLPGRGKTHFVAALGRELILRHGLTVLFTPTFKLVQQLLNAKKALKLEAALKKLDRYAVVVLDDIGYVQQDREEMEVLFTFLAERYERRSVMITSNLVFSKWDQIFKDPLTTLAAIDRLVHHATILEFDGESVRAQKAKTRQSE